MTFKFSTASQQRLIGVHPDLVKVMRHAITISSIDFKVLEGVRTLARQKQLVAEGASRTLNSRHLTGHAVDVVPMIAGKIRWDWPLYHRLALVIKQAAIDKSVPIEWGGDWKGGFKDGPHWQLPRR